MTEPAVGVSDPAFEKEERLKAILSAYGRIAVAYSGGVDSTYLAAVAHEVLGKDAELIIADSPSIPRSELAAAKALARERGWNLTLIKTNEFDREEYLENGPLRCYHCKTELFQQMEQYARDKGVMVTAYGAIAEDALDLTRVGHRAAKERAVAAPLQEVGLTKEEIRKLSRHRGLPTADKASFACLASRFPTGIRVSREAISAVERAEETLKSFGFHQYRVRHHGDLCRIEVEPVEFARLLEPGLRDAIVRSCRDAGYRFVTLDLAGYHSGSSAIAPDASLGHASAGMMPSISRNDELSDGSGV
jgi:uncharacterized protein